MGAMYEPLRNARGRVPWIAVVALLALAGGLAAWYMSTPAGQKPRQRDVIDQALALADPDSSAIKTKWIESVPEIDVSDLDPETHETYVRLINARFCTCGCGYTLGACQNFDPTCEISGPIVETLLDSLRAGHPMSTAGLRPRPEAG